MDDTRERFLTAIVDRLGAGRIVELHLFSPIRQGVMETGVAVVAALPDSGAGDETPADSRHVVFTAGYRLTRKGPDRGKWSFELAATADAPLATVDTVVRGVMHRSRDLTESERLSGDQLRAILARPAWRTTP